MPKHQTSEDAERSADKSQSDKFKEAAREVEADDDEKRFDEQLKRVAKPRPQGKRS